MMLGRADAIRRIAELEQEMTALAGQLAAATGRITIQDEAIEQLAIRLRDALDTFEAIRAGDLEQVDHLAGSLAGQGEQIGDVRDMLAAHTERCEQTFAHKDAVARLDLALRGLSRRIDIDAEEAAKMTAALLERIELGRRPPSPM